MQTASNIAFDEHEFALTDKQREAQALFGSVAQYILLYGGARSAKTFVILRTIATRAFGAAGSRHAVLRFRFNHVKASIVFDTFPKMMDLCFPGIKYTLSKAEWYVTLPNGSEIWFGGLDDKERTEKILGNEYVSIFLNECSQISYNSYLTVLTRLAQKVTYQRAGETRQMRTKMFFDENPPGNGHWTHKMFIQKQDPESRKALKDPELYASLLMNPTDNLQNLPASYLRALDNMPKRQRDRFYLGKFGDETENALWTDDIINGSKIDDEALPQLVRVVIGVDPSGASDDPDTSNDDIGIVVVGLGTDGIAYVLEDLTIKAGPKKWGDVVRSGYDRHQADRVVGEVNFGGAMVEYVIKGESAQHISYKAVVASRGKMLRAEPISALHEGDKVRMCGDFPELEDEMLACTTHGYTGARSPNHLDAFVFAVTELHPQVSRGPKPAPKQAPHVPQLRRF